MWIRFTDRFDWKPNASTTVAYRPGSYNVPRAAADAAIAAGKAVRQVKDSRDGEPTDVEEA